jgi:hypothetical protein
MLTLAKEHYDDDLKSCGLKLDGEPIKSWVDLDAGIDNPDRVSGFNHKKGLYPLAMPKLAKRVSCDYASPYTRVIMYMFSFFC